jgi:hypothetical protein
MKDWIKAKWAAFVALFRGKVSEEEAELLDAAKRAEQRAKTTVSGWTAPPPK